MGALRGGLCDWGCARDPQSCEGIRIHSPRAWGAPHSPGTPQFPFPRDGRCDGEELGELPGAHSRVFELPQLPPHPTHADPKTAPGWPQIPPAPRVIPGLERGVFFPRESRLSRETPVAVRMGGGSLCIPELGEIPKLSQSPSSALLLPGRSVRNSEGAKPEHGGGLAGDLGSKNRTSPFWIFGI